MNIIEKDILTVERGIIVHQVNCRGEMNSGVAKALRNKWPQVYKEYKEYCDGNSNMLGGYQFVKINDGLFVVNLFGQEKYGYDGQRYTSYAAWEKALPGIKEIIKINDMLTMPIYFPYLIGCDRGGGDFRIITAMIEEYFQKANFCKL